MSELASERLTCDLIADEFTRLELAYGGEERPDLLLGHVLRQVVDNEVSLGLLNVAALRRVGRGRAVLSARVHAVHHAGYPRLHVHFVAAGREKIT